MELKELMANLPKGAWVLIAVPPEPQGVTKESPFHSGPDTDGCGDHEEGPKEVKCATAPPAVQEAPAVQEEPEQAPVERPAGCRCPDFSLDFNAKDAMCIRCVSKAECAAAMPR